MMKKISLLFLSTLFVFLVSAASADVTLPTIFGSNMVLQRNLADPVWGKAEPGESVSVSINGQTKAATTGADGKWSLKLDPMNAGGPFEMTIKGKNELKFDNVMVGEVWLCSGQSNMGMSVKNSNDAEKEIAAAIWPNIRLITVPAKSVPEPQDDFNGAWKPCSPETVPGFSAAAYYFGRKIFQELDGVAVGLIHSSWGGSTCEAWVRKEVLAADSDWPEYVNRLKKLEELEAAKDKNFRPQHKAYYLYNGMINPIKTYGIRGAIWYQGESNAGRAWQYRTLFPLLINNWRDDWKQGDFPFYFVQLANYMAVKEQPGDSAWAELREAQSRTLSVPKTGQAVIIDIGEAKDVHPKNKQDVGLRLAYWALAKDYGKKDLVYSGPVYSSMKVDGSKIVLSFDHVGGGLMAKDGGELKGFAIAGENEKFVWADAKIVGKTIEVSAKEIDKPVAVRYAWADNPICNLANKEGIPASPFRTDDWQTVTFGKK